MDHEMNSVEDEELDSSELGTQKYWDKAYSNELNNFQDHGDVGEVWFGEESIIRILKWLNSYNCTKKDDPVVDLGCGNGMMLVELAREGYTNLMGVDYSKQAIELASTVVKNLEYQSIISFKACDVLCEDIADIKFSLALDKGTYDAICLNPENAKENRLKYIHKVYEMLRPQGLFIITSCNWTDSEITSHFKQYFNLYSVIPTPEFKFGGKTGKLLSCLVLQRVD
ncbi:EEF1A lysine methyltransferase 2 [Planococcus citri]|uniref:EEF1A lysine methyltransferase 2 n=1 Tax=Planococcus citri TaxID=170843 RepID=UPI0031F7C22D